MKERDKSVGSIVIEMNIDELLLQDIMELEQELVDVVMKMNVAQTHITVLMKLIVQTQ